MGEVEARVPKQKIYPEIGAGMFGASEQHTSNSRILVKLNEDKNEVTIQVDRLNGATGRPIFDSLVLRGSEADALLTALMDEIG